MDVREQDAEIPFDAVHEAEGAPQKEQIVVERKPVYEFVKRFFDIVVSLICLTVGLPVYLIMILAIVIDDPGESFLRAEKDRASRPGFQHAETANDVP